MSNYIIKNMKFLIQCSFLILSIQFSLFAQEETNLSSESSEITQDTSAILEEPWPLNKKGEPKGSGLFVLSAVRLGVDMRPLMQSALDKNMSAYTLYSDLMIRNAFYVTMEYGQMDRTRTNSNSEFFNYNSNGSFYRFGMEYNVMKKASTSSGLTFGFKYANSTFDQSADYYSTGNGYWEEGATLKHLTEKNINVDWYEITVSLKLALYKGLTVDFGFAYTVKKDFPATVITKNDIPGWYFNKDDRSRLNFQYRLLYRIPCWPMYTTPRAKKKK